MRNSIRPLHDRLVVERLEEGEQMKGGILIPDSAKEKPQQGKVIAVGNGKRLENGTLIALDVQAGDRILFGNSAVRGKLRQRTVSLYRSISYGLFCQGTI